MKYTALRERDGRRVEIQSARDFFLHVRLAHALAAVILFPLGLFTQQKQEVTDVD